MTDLILELPGDHLFIDSLTSEAVRIGDHDYPGSILVTRDTVVEDWAPPAAAQLEEKHFEVIFSLEPEVVLLGTGATQHFLRPEKLAPFYRKAVGIEVMSTAAACRTFNVLVAEGRRVVAALLPPGSN